MGYQRALSISFSQFLSSLRSRLQRRFWDYSAPNSARLRGGSAGRDCVRWSGEREVETFYSGGGATKRVCDGYGGKREKKKKALLVDWIDSPKGLGPDAGGKQKPIKECDSLGSGLND